MLFFKEYFTSAAYSHICPPSDIGSFLTFQPLDIGSFLTFQPLDVGSFLTFQPSDVGIFLTFAKRSVHFPHKEDIASFSISFYERICLVSPGVAVERTSLWTLNTCTLYFIL